MWTEGLARIWPAWEFYFWHHTIPAVVWVALIMGLVFTLLIVYPFLEKRFSGDHAHHNLLQRPRDVPVRTSIGAMAIAFYMVLTLAAMNDIIAFQFHISLNATTWIGRIGMASEIDPALGWVNRAMPAAWLDAGREREAGDGVTDHLALATAEAADGIAHEQNLGKIVAAQGGAAEVLAGAELTLDRNTVVGV